MRKQQRNGFICVICVLDCSFDRSLLPSFVNFQSKEKQPGVSAQLVAFFQLEDKITSCCDNRNMVSC